MRPPSDRIDALDALRGIAAFMVVAFHYTARFPALYGEAHGIGWPLSAGGQGVQLFFVISGFVIVMTLARTRHALDFVRSRFARLYPAFWAAVLLTWGVVQALGLPGREVAVTDLPANLSMLPERLRRPPVDGVYWSLEVELFFYAAMLALWVAGQLRAIRHWMLGWVALACVDAALVRLLGRPLPLLHDGLILPHIPFFAIGVLYWHRLGRVAPGLTGHAGVAACIAAAAWVGGPADGLTALVCAGVFELLVRRRLDGLARGPLLWAGAVSYPLYLVHQNIGYATMLRLQTLGLGPAASLALALAGVCVLATAITRWVERPALARLKPHRVARVAAG